MSKIMTLKEAKETLEYAYDYKAITGFSIDVDVIDVLEYAVEALIPPTADEVCKALSEWFGTQVFYEDEPFEERPNVFIKSGLFYYGKKRHDMNKQEYIHKSIIVIGSEDLMTFNSQLPPHIIEMIAKFFKGEIK